MNWSNVVWTQSAPAAATKTFTGVTSVQHTMGGSVQKSSGDGDHFPTCVVSDFQEPSVTVQCRDLAVVNSLLIGGFGTLVATHNDAYAVREGAAGNKYTLTLTGVCQDHSGGGGHRQYGEGTAVFVGESADGTTNPLTFA